MLNRTVGSLNVSCRYQWDCCAAACLERSIPCLELKSWSRDRAKQIQRHLPANVVLTRDLDVDV